MALRSLGFVLSVGILVPCVSGSSFVACADDSFESTCEQIGDRIDIENVTVVTTEYVPAGGNISVADIPTVCGDNLASQVPVDLCRVYMNVSTTDRSGIRLEAWFPRDYNGRFLSTGNGGLGGCISYSDIAYATKFGFASVGANNGHDGDTGQYFLGNSDVLEDYAYRSVHTGVVVGKQLTDLFYEQGFNKSYYLGCSTGGRQGLKSVQDYPDDFDGVIAGAPAINLINLISWGAYAAYLTGPPNSTTFLSTEEWLAVGQEVMRQCDGIDGVVDGIIEDPDLCRPVVETLLCNQTSTSDSLCLTSDQVETVNAIYTDWTVDDVLHYPRLNPGAELLASFVYFSGSMFQYPSDWYRYVVFNDSDWDTTTWTPEDAKLALAQNPFNVQTFNGDLSAFKARGGKLLSYHGTSDGIISSDDSKLYYRHVAREMNLSPSDLDEFYRFFGISGLGHCSGGDGATYIGQSLQGYVDSVPENNLLLDIVDWVENGIAPEYLRGAKVADDGETVEYFRKHCRYPKRNRYVGPGEYTDEDAWQCV
ncbi:hypothetical protein jhhlp_008772 [Lomentospora prolificans]|uniref:Carboxylic ester hydrolase n=1 Tax=Lomentospora prolificans TaxID=41688 RepID=A0A2N3MYY8_9PEZI|nr:hypothetical protein jhhlp_008772 [Lomentospora prolificans]